MINDIIGLLTVGALVIPALLLAIYFYFDQNKIQKKEKKS